MSKPTTYPPQGTYTVQKNDGCVDVLGQKLCPQLPNPSETYCTHICDADFAAMPTKTCKTTCDKLQPGEMLYYDCNGCSAGPAPPTPLCQKPCDDCPDCRSQSEEGECIIEGQFVKDPCHPPPGLSGCYDNCGKCSNKHAQCQAEPP